MADNENVLPIVPHNQDHSDSDSSVTDDEMIAPSDRRSIIHSERQIGGPSSSANPPLITPSELPIFGSSSAIPPPLAIASASTPAQDSSTITDIFESLNNLKEGLEVLKAEGMVDDRLIDEAKTLMALNEEKLGKSHSKSIVDETADSDKPSWTSTDYVPKGVILMKNMKGSMSSELDFKNYNFTCNECGEGPFGTDMFFDHLYSHYQSEIEDPQITVYKCRETGCTDTFEDADALFGHIVSHHAGQHSEPSLTALCDCCLTVFLNEKAYKEHLIQLDNGNLACPQHDQKSTADDQ